MVTASHNPGSYIGLKLMAQDVFPLAYGCGKEGGIKKIKEIYLSGPTLIEGEKKGSLEVINYLDDYISYSMELSEVKEGRGRRSFLNSLMAAPEAKSPLPSRRQEQKWILWMSSRMETFQRETQILLSRHPSPPQEKP